MFRTWYKLQRMVNELLFKILFNVLIVCVCFLYVLSSLSSVTLILRGKMKRIQNENSQWLSSKVAVSTSFPVIIASSSVRCLCGRVYRYTVQSRLLGPKAKRMFLSYFVYTVNIIIIRLHRLYNLITFLYSPFPSKLFYPLFSTLIQIMPSYPFSQDRVSLL